MTNKEYEYIIEQQKEIIKQLKELIDSLMHACTAPNGFTCDGKCKDCCYAAMLC